MYGILADLEMDIHLGNPVPNTTPHICLNRNWSWHNGLSHFYNLARQFLN